MATNQTRVTISVDTTYAAPLELDYHAITLVDSIDVTDQLLIVRNDIVSIFQDNEDITLSQHEKQRFEIVPSAWLTLNTTTQMITGITIPDGEQLTLDDNTVVTYPAFIEGESLTIKRASIQSEPYVTWVTGSKITADQLNLNTGHLLGLIQETSDELLDCVHTTDPNVVLNPMTVSLDMDSNKITNMADPTSDQDAATKAYVDAAIAAAVTDKLGQPLGIATLDINGSLASAQRVEPVGVIPGSFFASSTQPVRSSGSGSGLYGYGSMWYNSTNGRLYIYISDDAFAHAGDPTYDGSIGYWVDVSATTV